MAFLREWLLGVTAAALAIALAQSVTPEGTVKKVGKLVGGLVLLLAVVKPIAQVDPTALTGLWTASGYETEAAAQGGEEVLKILIAQKTGAYIVDKGQSLGCRVTEAQVTVADDGSGWPVPWSVVVNGDWTLEQRVELSRVIAEELAIPSARQLFQKEGA